MGEWLARFLITNAFGQYRCDAIERSVLACLGESPACPADRSEHALHIITEAYPYGGHTRFLKQVLEASDLRDHILVSGSTSLDEAVEILQVEPSRIIKIEQGDVRLEIVAMAKAIARFKTAYLYIHPDDVRTAVAALMAKAMRSDLKIGFINHADHSFSTGLAASDFVFELSSYGWGLREARQISDRASFIGIPIAPSQKVFCESENKSYAFSAGAGYKYKPFRQHSLPPLLMALLREHPQLSMIVVGPDPKDPWWKPLRHFDNRVTVRRAVPYNDYLKYLEECKFFIDSYPKPGGTVFAEALISGASVIGLKGGSWGYSCADALRVSSPEEFIEVAKKILARDQETLFTQSIVRSHCLEFHHPSAVVSRLKSTMETGVLHKPPEMLYRLGPSPFFAEIEWYEKAKIKIKLPSTKIANSIKMHRTILLAYINAFGFWNIRSFKLWYRFHLRKLRQNGKASRWLSRNRGQASAA